MLQLVGGSICPLALVTSRTVLSPAIGGGREPLSTTPATIQISQASLPRPLSRRGAAQARRMTGSPECCIWRGARLAHSSARWQRMRGGGHLTIGMSWQMRGAGPALPFSQLQGRLTSSPTSRVSMTVLPGRRAWPALTRAAAAEVLGRLTDSHDLGASFHTCHR